MSNTIESIRAAGWDEITVYGEPGLETAERAVIRPHQYGCWVNWVCALFDMYQTGVGSEMFVIFEDDIQMCRNVRAYLDELLPSLGRFGTVSLYTPSHMKKHAGGLNCVHDESDMGGRVWGTQGIVFTEESLGLFLSHRETVAYRRESLGVENKNRDSAIGMWAKSSGKKVYYHTPSLMQHVGVASSVGHEFHESDDFVGVGFDALDLLANKAKVVPARDRIAMI